MTTDFTAYNLTINLTIPTLNIIIPVTSVNEWIVIQQRIDNSTSFNQSWSVYKNGFGTYNRNYWMGLERVYRLLREATYRMRIEFLVANNNNNNTWLSVEYDTFLLGSETAFYQINATGYSGDSGDLMNSLSTGKMVSGMKFSTYDVDNDLNAGNCATSTFEGSGWWYNRCGGFVLNGPYINETGNLKICSSACVFTYISTSRIMIKQS